MPHYPNCVKGYNYLINTISLELKDYWVFLLWTRGTQQTLTAKFIIVGHKVSDVIIIPPSRTLNRGGVVGHVTDSCIIDNYGVMLYYVCCLAIWLMHINFV